MITPARLDVDALYVALDRKRRRQRLRWRDVAQQAGVVPSGLSRISQGRRPDVDNLVRMLAWLGTTDLGPYVTTIPEVLAVAPAVDPEGKPDA